ncbi:hypothetical protein GCK32_013720 [Trichostrongylus colubriformis]|uniref:Uncharacterized protein n=1 Tax=Trichostrongylus colubriformis TaxID=6319 RepID=A0AAN8GEV9_TRICO
MITHNLMAVSDWTRPSQKKQDHRFPRDARTSQDVLLLGTSTSEPPPASQPPPPSRTSVPQSLPPRTSASEFLPPYISAFKLLPSHTSTSNFLPPRTSTSKLLPPRTSTSEFLPPRTSASKLLPPRTSAPRSLPPSTAASKLLTRHMSGLQTLPSYTKVATQVNRVDKPNRSGSLSDVDSRSHLTTKEKKYLARVIAVSGIILMVSVPSPRHFKDRYWQQCLDKYFANINNSYKI